MSHFIDKRLSFSIFKDLDSFFLDFKIREIPYRTIQIDKYGSYFSKISFIHSIFFNASTGITPRYNNRAVD